MTQSGFEQLDPLFEHRVRMAVCALLARNDEINFSRFKALLQQTDGALGAQLRKLEDVGYISLRRSFENRRPVTWYRLDPRGRQALHTHLNALGTLVNGSEYNP